MGATLAMVWVSFLILLVFVFVPSAIATVVLVLVNNFTREHKLGWLDSLIIFGVISFLWWLAMCTIYL